MKKVFKFLPILALVFSIATTSCDDNLQPALKLSVEAAKNVTISQAEVSGSISKIGIAKMIQHGHCWSTSTKPTISDSKTELGIILADGSFTSTLENLAEKTTYYVRTYSVSDVGEIYYSEVISFTTEENKIVEFGDDKLKQTLLDDYEIDTDKDGEISLIEAEAYSDTIDVSKKELTSLAGLEHFKNIIALFCNDNSLTNLEAGSFTKLKTLKCQNNKISAINLSKCVELTYLNAENNKLTSLDLSANTLLTELQCAYNTISTLNVANCTKLKTISCYNNSITALNVDDCTALESLICSKNKLTTLDLSKCVSVKRLSCQENEISNLNITGCTLLANLTCNNNSLTTLDVSTCTSLGDLNCQNNNIECIKIAAGQTISTVLKDSATTFCTE